MQHNTLHSRAESINSSVPGKDEETKQLRQALTSNGYPGSVIHRHSMQYNSRTVDQSDAQGPVVTLPYVQVVQRWCILTPLGVKVFFRPHTTLRHLLIIPKDHIAERKLSAVVYQVSCAGCPATYVGQMGRYLNQRLSEHRWVVESGEAATSALATHACGAHYLVDWDKVKVFDHKSHHHQRLSLEYIHIRS